MGLLLVLVGHHGVFTLPARNRCWSYHVLRYRAVVHAIMSGVLGLGILSLCVSNAPMVR